ncbi:MAG: hypothetical protein M3356_02700 [Actinomycetota bacterium]|nr:hypothetical protein [Actinomycetota bacterium]
MTEAIFGLVGVLVGGVLSGVVAWFQDHARIRAEARAAALLVTEELIRTNASLLPLRTRQTWQIVRDSPWFGGRAQWEANRGLLARRLTIFSIFQKSWTMDSWMTASSAYGNIEALVSRVPGKG